MRITSGKTVKIIYMPTIRADFWNEQKNNLTENEDFGPNHLSAYLVFIFSSVERRLVISAIFGTSCKHIHIALMVFFRGSFLLGCRHCSFLLSFNPGSSQGLVDQRSLMIDCGWRKSFTDASKQKYIVDCTKVAEWANEATYSKRNKVKVARR